ncbi:MAG: MBL fold metallo-hydrolase [Fimbriimonas sp.]
MNLRLLGTGAADGIPGMFASNRVCEVARTLGGKDVRSRSSAIIDDHILLDFGPDTWHQFAREGLRARDLSAVMFTHGHDDHFAVNELQYCMFPFVDDEIAPFAIYANPQVSARIWEKYPDWPLEVHAVHCEQTFVLGDYLITPIEANHKEDEESLNYIVERDGRRLLYATDTGIYPEHTFKFLKTQRIDTLVIECTEGFKKTAYPGHLDIAQCVQMVSWMRQFGVLRPGSRVITTHHSHEGEATHGELEVELAKHGIEPGFDGMQIEV